MTAAGASGGEGLRARVRAGGERVVREFRGKHLLVQASAISFRVLVAIVPVSLFVIAVLGAIDLKELWRQEALPELRQNVSPHVVQILDDAVIRVMESENTYWITIGALVAVFSLASIVDAVTRTLNRIHDVEDERSLLERWLNAAAIGTLTGLLFVMALAAVRLGPLLVGDGAPLEIVSFLVRWGIAAALLVAAVTLMIRVAPDMERPLRRVGIGALITVGGWIVTSIAFGLYLEYAAAYDSLFGQLATIYITLQYVALSAIVYVGGLVIDAVAVRDERGRGG